MTLYQFHLDAAGEVNAIHDFITGPSLDDPDYRAFWREVAAGLFYPFISAAWAAR